MEVKMTKQVSESEAYTQVSKGGWNPMSIFESIFGRFKKPATESKKRRCRRCHSKYNPEAIKIRVDASGKAPTSLPFEKMHFCSYECAAEQDHYSMTSRQSLRHALRKTSAVTVAHQMGAGPAAMNPRRARRKATREMAKRLYRER